MIGVYVKFDDNVYRLDLFQDENIDITFSQQDINDISKVFTDYSQNFSIPATPNNNNVFKYWYENALDNGFDDSKKLECWIELNGNFFRSGKLKLEKATIVNGKAKDYSVSFFGNLVSLKDEFKDDKLIDLTQINDIIDFTYTKENVLDLVVNSNTSNIAFPLITGTRVWDYGENTAPEGQKSTDISTLEGSIEYAELFPAVRVKTLFEAFEQKYNVNFVGDFLDDKRFTELFLYCKNSDNIKYSSGTKSLNVNEYEGDDMNFRWDVLPAENRVVYNGLGDSDDIDNTMAISVNAIPTVSYKIYVYKNDVLFTTFEGAGDGLFNIFSITDRNDSLYIGSYNFKIEVTNGNIESSSLIFFVENEDEFGGGFILEGTSVLMVSELSKLPVNLFMPDIKISDFFSGILSMFNLTCYSENGEDFIIKPLGEWYADGFTVDITKYCEPNWEVNKTKQYKSINFKYEKSESVINDKFYQVFQRYYGDLEFIPQTQDKDGEEYKIQLPFENLMHMKFSGTKLHVGYNVNKDLKPYTPKPILLYKWGNISDDVSYYIEDELKTSYNAFGQDLEYTEGVFYTLNWGLENSTLLDGVVENTLYAVYYQAYLNELFSLKARQINTKGIFNLNTLITLKLNDKVIIRDKRYRINKLQTNLNKQTFSIELITDLT